MHSVDHARLIRENVALTNEVNELRRESKDISLQHSSIMLSFENFGHGGGGGGSLASVFDDMNLLDAAPTPPTGSARRSASSARSRGGTANAVDGMQGMNTALVKELELQRMTIEQLQERMQQLQSLVEDERVEN
jgi:hypothetical protein